MAKTIVAAALGECVHVAGVLRFLHLAEQAGWRTIFLGPAVTPEALLKAAVEEHADLVGVSYRLTPETGERLIGQFCELADELKRRGVLFAFGGTPPVAERVKKLDFFDAVFDGSEAISKSIAFLQQGTQQISTVKQAYPQKLLERIRWKAPYPVLRHHFGLPSMPETVAGIEQIARSEMLDILSLGIDQDAQENFFHPERQDARRKGAGGVPVRSAEDYRQLYQASRSGNYPLMRTYSGTDDFIQLAEMYMETIHNAWCAIPLFWFNLMDGRGKWDLRGSIAEHQKVMAWYGERNIPVELNEPHHWGMRYAPDVVFVVSAYLSAVNAKYFGVRDFILPMMFNSPPETAERMDLAKMLAALEIIRPLEGEGFSIWRQTRTGLLSYPQNPEAARAHLATSVYLQMSLEPHIIHVVGFSEADHAAKADEVIASCQIAQRAIENALNGQPRLLVDDQIQTRKQTLIQEAQITLDAIRNQNAGQTTDPFIDVDNLAQAVENGILDAPHLKGTKIGCGKILTKIIAGRCEAVDESGRVLTEKERLRGWL